MNQPSPNQTLRLFFGVVAGIWGFPLPISDSRHLLAAEGWLDLGAPLEADAELDCIAPELRAHLGDAGGEDDGSDGRDGAGGGDTGGVLGMAAYRLLKNIFLRCP